MFYLVGLGNPGDKYTDTRHNIGRSYIEQYAASHGVTSWSKHKHANALYTHAIFGGQSVELLLPETFMNKSGDTLAYYVKKHEAEVTDFIVLHDDIDLAVGEIKISRGRGDGGNNGVRSIIQRLDTKDFVRIRIGIAPKSFWTGKMTRPKGGKPLERFVLQSFSVGERRQLTGVYEKVTAAIECLVKHGPEQAMNQFN